MELPDITRVRKAVRRRRRRLGRFVGGLPALPPDPDERDRTAADRVGINDLGPEYHRIIDTVWRYTKTSRDRIAALCLAVDYIVDHNIDGAVVECGLWKGGSLLAAAMRLLDHGAVDREVIGYDTFAGMTKPTEHDVSWLGVPELPRWRASSPSTPGSGQSEQDIRTLLESNGWAPDHLRLVAGAVEDTLPEHAPGEIALLRLDTDWYESTRHELEQLYPRLTVGGVLIVDDYGHYPGAKKAVDEYFSGHRIFLHRIDYSGRIAVKQTEYHPHP